MKKSVFNMHLLISIEQREHRFGYKNVQTFCLILSDVNIANGEKLEMGKQ